MYSVSGWCYSIFGASLRHLMLIWSTQHLEKNVISIEHTASAVFVAFCRLEKGRILYGLVKTCNCIVFIITNKIGHFRVLFPGSSCASVLKRVYKCKIFHMKMSSACSFIFMQIKVIFIRMVSHLDSLWNRGTRELGNDLLYSCPNLSVRFILKIFSASIFS